LILDLLNDTEQVPQDFEPFRNLRIHSLRGDLKDFWSLDVTGNYRIIFKFESKNVFEIDLVDTH
jgi:proteic killer suppression protein